MSRRSRQPGGCLPSCIQLPGSGGSGHEWGLMGKGGLWWLGILPGCRGPSGQGEGVGQENPGKLQIKTTLRSPPTRTTTTPTTEGTTCWRGRVHCCWGWRTVPSPWKKGGGGRGGCDRGTQGSTHGHLALRTESRDADKYVHSHVPGSVSPADQMWKQPQRPPTDEGTDTMWPIDTVKWSSALERKELLTPAPTWGEPCRHCAE